VLIGPTGSGKTPLGRRLEARGLWGRRCRHFDFGARLRRIAADGDPTGRLGPQQLDVIRSALASHALLEDRNFPVARAILEAFLAEGRDDADAWIVLNGLPRHIGQARDIDKMVRVQAVIELSCSARVIWQRIRTNVGGDRAARTDDSLPVVRKRLADFHARTAPLIDQYRAAGARIIPVAVSSADTADDLWRAVNEQPPPRPQRPHEG